MSAPEKPTLDHLARPDTQQRARRDLARRRRRASPGRFWHAVGLMGSVGWPIVLLAIAGAWFGRYLDGRFGTGVRFSLMLLAMGTSFGTWIAFKTLRGPS